MIKNDKAHLRIQAASHPGMTGKQNEDRYRVTSFLTNSIEKTPSVLAVLCDGIGGHRAGEVAAEIGVSVITETIGVGSSRRPLRTLEKAVRRASDVIYVASQEDSSRLGMGATCACAWVIRDRLYTVNLGDSRIYLLREGHFFQLTTDHTWIQEALDAGIITDEMGINHPNAHVIRRYLGSKKAPEPDFRLWVFDGEEDQDAINNQGLRLQTGDAILLCSDGLTDLASDVEIRDMIQDHPLEEVPELLIDLANSRGGHDNITVVLMEVPSIRSQAKKRRWRTGCLIALLILSIFTTAILVGVRVWSTRLIDLDISPSPGVTQSIMVSTLDIESTPMPTGAEDELMETLPDSETPQPTITAWPTNTFVP